MPVTLAEIFAPLPEMERGKAYVLGGDPQKKNFLYTNSKAVIIRDVENPKKCDVYTEHTKKASSAQYSPSRFYICSGDITGKIRIWDTVNKEHILKKEFQPISGEIRDIAWGPDSKRIGVSGRANENHAAVVMADSGNNVGRINQVGKCGNSITYRQVRPYRLAVGDDEFVTSVYEGPPFTAKFNLREHKRFVHCVRYSPDGEFLATASADGHIFLYDGKTTEPKGQLGCEKKGAHAGGIYSLSWSPDNKELLSVSGDKSAKIWNLESKEEVMKFEMGNTMECQQLSSLWMGDYLLTVSLSGQINYLDRKDPSKPSRILNGHSSPLTKIVTIPGDKLCHVSADNSGKILKWDTDSGDAQLFSGTGHSGKVSGLAYDASTGDIISAGWDDKICFISASSCDFSSATILKLDSQPLSITLAGDDCVVLNCHKSIVLIKNKKKVFEMPQTRDFTAASIAACGKEVAIDGKGDKVLIYHIDCDSLVKSDIELEATMGALGMSYSPDGSMLAVGAGSKGISIYLIADGYKLRTEFIGHHMKPTVFAWSPDSQVLATSGIDASLRVWNIATEACQDRQKAHTFAFITAMTWLDNVNLLTAGDDCLTKQWAVSW